MSLRDKGVPSSETVSEPAARVWHSEYTQLALNAGVSASLGENLCLQHSGMASVLSFSLYLWLCAFWGRTKAVALH